MFTLPAEIADIAFQNKALVDDLLFKEASETMTTIAADPKHLGGRIGITAVLLASKPLVAFWKYAMFGVLIKEPPSTPPAATTSVNLQLSGGPDQP